MDLGCQTASSVTVDMLNVDSCLYESNAMENLTGISLDFSLLLCISYLAYQTHKQFKYRLPSFLIFSVPKITWNQRDHWALLLFIVIMGDVFVEYPQVKEWTQHMESSAKCTVSVYLRFLVGFLIQSQISVFILLFFLKGLFEPGEMASVVKSTYRTCKSPEFYSQHPPQVTHSHM